MRVLIACEESQAVCVEFRKRGHESCSCDTEPCSGGHQEWHIQDDVLKHLSDDWDMMIAFPPCTHLCVSGARHFPAKRADGRQQQGIDFFMAIANAPIERIAIENPVGIMSKIWRKPDQIIQPYYFGDEAQKTTCLWLKNMPKLHHQSKPDLLSENVTHVKTKKHISKNGIEYEQIHFGMGYGWNTKECKRARSKTFPGIAKAMAEQWGKL